MNPNLLMTNSLHTSADGERVARIMAAALDAVDPAKAVERYMLRDGSRLTIGSQIYDLAGFERVFLIGFGKASLPMGEAALLILGDFFTQGILITKGQGMDLHPKLSILVGSHPVPDLSSLGGAQQIVDLLSTTTKKDLVIFLISGGGSALLTLPVTDISLPDIQDITGLLLGCGATIQEINCLRKHLSQVKGGQLARRAAPAQVATLILSDVVGDQLDVIASGPTVPDSTNYADALAILRKYEIDTNIPASIEKHLLLGVRGEIPETPKAGDLFFEMVQNTLVANNYQAAKAAMIQAETEGFHTSLLTTSLQGEARTAGLILAAILRQVALTGEPIPRPACLIAGGETTVTIRGNGRGGRNQELALASVMELAGIPNVMLITLATDGDDGPTDAAGAVVTGESMKRAQLAGLNPAEFLNRNASYEFFDIIDDLLKPGLTQTNVNDLTFLLAF